MTEFQAIAAALLLPGCTFYGTPIQIEGWPDLKIVEHRVTLAEVKKECAQYAPWWGTVGACAVYYPYECHVWAADEWTADIERENCEGKARPYWRDQMTEIRDKIWRQRDSGR